MTLEEKIRRLPPEKREVIEQLVNLLLGEAEPLSSGGMEDFRKLRGILKDKVDTKDAVKLQHEVMRWFDEEISFRH